MCNTAVIKDTITPQIVP